MTDTDELRRRAVLFMHGASKIYEEQGDRADMRKDADARIRALWDQPIAGIVGGRDMMGAMVPGAVDALAQSEIFHLGPQFGDLADRFIAEGPDRIGPAWRAVDEQAPRLVPPLVHERAGSAILGQFGTGADAGKEGADADLAGRERRIGDVLETEAPRRFEDQSLHAGTALASTARRVGARITSRIPTATK